jgi:hypothetical protein
LQTEGPCRVRREALIGPIFITEYPLKLVEKKALIGQKSHVVTFFLKSTRSMVDQKGILSGGTSKWSSVIRMKLGSGRGLVQNTIGNNEKQEEITSQRHKSLTWKTLLNKKR